MALSVTDLHFHGSDGAGNAKSEIIQRPQFHTASSDKPGSPANTTTQCIYIHTYI